MINKNTPIYLASKSPRRKVLLQQLNLKFKVFSVDCDESLRKNEPFIQAVKRLSLVKLEAAKKNTQRRYYNHRRYFGRFKK